MSVRVRVWVSFRVRVRISGRVRVSLWVSFRVRVRFRVRDRDGDGLGDRLVFDNGLG